MPEAKPTGHVGLANEVEPQQLVQGLERRSLGGRRGGRRELGFERVAGDRRALEHEAGAVREDGELLSQRGGNRRRHPQTRQRRLGDGRRTSKRERSGELLEVERVATALVVDGGRYC